MCPAKCGVCFPLSVKGLVNVYVSIYVNCVNTLVCLFASSGSAVVSVLLMQWFSLKGYPLPTSANPYQIRVCWYRRHMSFVFSCA